MVCIYCKQKTQVTNSRHLVRNNSVWRRRSCLACNAVFTSREVPDLATSFMIDAGTGDLLPFTKEKLLISLYESCRHRKSAVEDATALADTVLARVLREVTTSGVVPLTVIRNAAHATLQGFDPAAATYYKAYFCKK